MANKQTKIAIVHDYLVQRGGAERVLEAMLEVFPTADIFTGIYSPKNFGEIVTGKKVTSVTEGRKLLQKFPKYFTFLMPSLFESLDLREYDLVISITSGYAKGVLTNPDQLHISYINTPPRFLYGYSVETTKRNAWYLRPLVSIIDHNLRIWDFAAAQRPDYIISNSKEIESRVKKFYARESTVIYPPVDIELAQKPTPKNDALSQPYFLAIGRLVAYKNFDLIIEAFNLARLNLVIIGSGKEEGRLKKMAGDTVKFVGNVSDDEKHQYLSNCLGLIFPVVDEDFGIVPIEAMAHGKPVLAHRSGGPLETVVEHKSGLFFDEANLDSFISKLKEFDDSIRMKKFDSEFIKESVQKFTKDSFQKHLLSFIEEKWKEHARTTRSNNNPQ